MPMARALTAGYAPATWNGGTITEIGPTDKALSATDCHFGLNPADDIATNAIKLCITETAKKDLAEYGPRAIDMARRGGIVAETLWEEWQSGNSPHSTALQKFLITFDDIGGKRAVTSANYPGGAMISGTDVGGELKYDGSDKSMKSLLDAMGKSGDAEPTGMQVGTRWSKISIESTVLNGGVVHFHLDGMGDVQPTCNKQGKYNYNVTSRELRYIFRNWKRLDAHCRFYNGYMDTSTGLRPMMVKAPWA